MSGCLVSIIIVNWNGKNYLSECLRSLQRVIYPHYEIILVDNGSTDGSVDFVQQFYPDVKIIRNKDNLGFAEANNRGVRESNGDYVLFLNNDTKVEPSFLTELLKIMDSDLSIAGCQSKILFMDNSRRLGGVGSFLTTTGILYHYGYKQADQDRFNKVVDIFSAKGACMLFRRAVLNEIGLFDGDFFAYFEETDLCWRAWLAGYRIVYAPTSVVYHIEGATSSQINSSFINFHSYKNRISSLIKNLGVSDLYKILPIHIGVCLGLILTYLALGKFGDAHSIGKAIAWNIIHLKSTLTKRISIQKNIRKLSDKEIMPKIVRKASLSYCYHLLRGDLENWDLAQTKRV